MEDRALADLSQALPNVRITHRAIYSSQAKLTDSHAHRTPSSPLETEYAPANRRSASRCPHGALFHPTRRRERRGRLGKTVSTDNVSVNVFV